MIAKDMNFIVNAANWQDFFCRNSSGEKIRYCVPYNEETAYGRKTRICYSEETALHAIEFVLKEYLFLFAITELDTLQLQFNPPLWHTTVDHVTVYADECLEFHFMNGIDVEVRM